MQFTMSHEFTMSRYHAAAWSVVGIAAGYGIYTIWSSNGSRPVSALHRSNTIHRTNRRQLESMEVVSPSIGAPLGQVVLRDGEASYPITLAVTPFPMQSQLGSHVTAERYAEIQGLAIEMAMKACFIAIRDATLWTYFNIELGFGAMLRAMSDRDENQIMSEALRLPEQLHMQSMPREQVEQAVASFFSYETWAAFVAASPTDSVADPAETEDLELSNTRREPSQGLRGLLYYIAEDDAKRKAYEHRGIICEECREQPIRGVRWHCLNCPDYDLCSSCEMHTTHPKTHVFAKIKIPLPVLSQPTRQFNLWYPGDPRKIHGPLDTNLKKRLCQEHGFEEPQMDALYDQFTCIANVPYPSDDGIVSSGVKAAIDRRAFNKALTCEKWKNRFAPNAMYDRIFAFYDTNRKGLIGFEDFVSGLAYLRGPKRFATLGRAARGFDLDDDGYVNRQDILRLLEAKFEVNQLLVKDAIEGQELQQTHKGMGTLRSSQPISSILAYDDIPPGEDRPSHGKQPDAYGDMQPLWGAQTILNDDSPWRRTIRPQRSHERLLNHLSRFEEMITVDDGHGRVDGAAEPSHGEAPGALPIIDINELHDDDEEEPHISDALWQVTRQGFNELLDRLFEIREDEDIKVADTAERRKQWRKEVDEEVRAAHEGWRARPRDDTTEDAWPEKWQLTSSPSPSAFTSNIVPTDNDTLARREREIPSRPLEDLLSESGYGLRDGGESSGRFAGRPSPLRNEILAEDSETPHRPQVNAQAPRGAQLLYWGNVIDVQERAMQERGGPGRLSYDEIETIVVDDPSGELRGLVKSWLEWAAF